MSHQTLFGLISIYSANLQRKERHLASMAIIQSISILQHTTASSPHPHVLYLVKTVLGNGQEYEVSRRYSQVNFNRLARHQTH